MREEKLDELESKIGIFKIKDLEMLNAPNKFLTVTPYKVTLKDGKEFIREKLTKSNKNGDAVIVLPFINNEVMITIEPRVFTKRGVGIGLTAGYIEKEETPEEAARRELLEETGYIAGDLISLGGFYQDTGTSSAYNRIFIAENLTKIGDRKLDESEYIENMTVTFDELYELMELGYSEDGNVIIATLKAKEFLRRREDETKRRDRENNRVYKKILQRK